MYFHVFQRVWENLRKSDLCTGLCSRIYKGEIEGTAMWKIREIHWNVVKMDMQKTFMMLAFYVVFWHAGGRVGGLGSRGAPWHPQMPHSVYIYRRYPRPGNVKTLNYMIFWKFVKIVMQKTLYNACILEGFPAGGEPGWCFGETRGSQSSARLRAVVYIKAKLKAQMWKYWKFSGILWKLACFTYILHEFLWFWMILNLWLFVIFMKFTIHSHGGTDLAYIYKRNR